MRKTRDPEREKQFEAPDPWQDVVDDQEALYPDQVLMEKNSENEAPPRSRRVERYRSEKMRPPYPYPVEDRGKQKTEKARTGRGRKEKREGFLPVILLMLLCVLLLTAMGWCWVRAIGNGLQHRREVEMVFRSGFPEGTRVNDTEIGGLTREEAAARMTDPERGSGDTEVNITVVVNGGGSYLLTSREIPFTANVYAVLDEAMNLVWRGAEESTLTPFEFRLRQRERIREEGAYYYTQVTYDREAVLRMVEQIAEMENIPALDAQLASFDFSSGTFTFTEEQPGRHIDSGLLYAYLINMLDQGVHYGTVLLDSYGTMPRVTRSQLMSSYGLVASYTTETTNEAARNTNVKLACEAVNGTVVQPGEVFSFNACTGQRTLEKGYLPAAAIAGGTTVDEVGGGVCQVSSTLFNACAMADLMILERSPHAWPSTYVDKGRDATVNWPGLDFSFRNDRDTPIFLTASYRERTCSVSVYGKLLPDGESIQLETRVIGEMPPPEEPEYVQDPALPPGTQQVVRKARTGYEVDTWRVYYSNGMETRRELMCTSTYKMIRERIAFN